MGLLLASSNKRKQASGTWANVPVINQDFELPVISTGGDRVFFNTSGAPIEGWYINDFGSTAPSRVAYRNLTDSQIDGGANEGINGLYSHEIVHTLTNEDPIITSVVGMSYRARIFAAYQKNFADVARYGTLRIRSNDVVMATLDFIPVENVWVEYSVEYTQGAANIGDMRIELGAVGVRDDDSILLFDNLIFEKM